MSASLSFKTLFLNRARERYYLQHNTTNREATLGLHTISSNPAIGHNIAVLGYVPRSSGLPLLGIDGVWRGLHVDAVGPETHESDVERKREERIENVHEEQGNFDEVKEHAQHADYEVVLRRTDSSR